MTGPQLAGRCILIAEDEFIVADSIDRMLQLWGATILGPVATVERALALVAAAGRLDGALLDINLRGLRAFPVADALLARCIPFAFSTGYSLPGIPARYRRVPGLQKPFDPIEIPRALFEGY